MSGPIIQIQSAKDRYTVSERRVADFCLQTFPRLVFETVSGVARATGTSPPTVMRFAQKAGFKGFTDLQRAATQSVDGDWERALDRLQHSSEGLEESWPTRGLRTDENDGLHWPRRDGLKWLHLASVVVGVDVA